jgi:hypothetical protein
MNKATRTILILVGVILGAFILFYLYGTSVYNGAVEKQEAVKKEWGNVQVAYQRRADLVPQLVATVKGVQEFLLRKAPLNCKRLVLTSTKPSTSFLKTIHKFVLLKISKSFKRNWKELKIAWVKQERITMKQ